MQTTLKRPRQLLVGAALTVGLVAVGLAVTGDSARALSLVTPALTDGGFFMPTGSRAATQQITLNGKPTRVQLCSHPTRSPRSVLTQYRAIAAEETLAGVPYLLEENADGSGTLVWAAPDGVRKAVTVSPGIGGGSEFRLITEPTPVPAATRLPNDTVLPGGILAPPGFRVAFCAAQNNGAGTAILEAPGSCRDVAAGLLRALRGARFDTDSSQLRDYESAGGSRNTRLILPFDHESGTLAGHLIVTPTPAGSRACLTVRRLVTR